MTFEEAFEQLMLHEGGYVDHPDDPGGETKYGVTARVARDYGYEGAMRDLPLEKAKEIARLAYWEPVRADELPPAIRFHAFDTAYHSGVGQAIRLLQRAVGAKDDGLFGPLTLAAVGRLNEYRLASRFNGQRLEFLASLSTWVTFGRGWARRVAINLKEA